MSSSAHPESSSRAPREVHLRIERLSKHFVGHGGARHTAFENLSLEIGRGEFVCIVGASGSGKTTLIRAIGGLAEPDGGRIEIDGKTVTGAGPERGFVFQHDSLLPWRTVLGNVVFGLEMRGVPRAERNRTAERLLALVGLTRVAQHYPAELSGGMRQRVNLARALAIDPEVLLMDEPFSALDAQTREVMQRELLELWARGGKTVLFITHQIDEAIYLADRVVVLGARPGGIRADLRIDFPRPRPLSLKRSPQFADMVERIWGLIEADVVAASNA